MMKAPSRGVALTGMGFGLDHLGQLGRSQTKSKVSEQRITEGKIAGFNDDRYATSISRERFTVMSLVNSLLGAIDNPNLQANANQLGNIVNTVQSLSQANSASPDAMQMAMGIVGKYVQSSLKQKRQQDGPQATQQLVNQYSGTQPNAAVVNALLGSQQAQGLINEVSAKTGLPAGTIQALLPSLIPLVLQFLQSGASLDGNNNELLNSFLDSDGDGDVDIADVMKLAGQFM
ncbi:MAG: DUF937 domain-containing protein [Cyanobacteria bacterium P01_G01_bin.54]